MTPFELASRFVGEIRELPGAQEHPFIQWSHSLCGFGPDTPDSVPWCSSFTNAICWLLRLPRSKSAAARSWLAIGQSVDLQHATVGFDVVVLMRGGGTQPGPHVLKAPGHVGFFAGYDPEHNIVQVLGGNQGNGVSVLPFEAARVLGLRRLR